MFLSWYDALHYSINCTGRRQHEESTVNVLCLSESVSIEHHYHTLRTTFAIQHFLDLTLSAFSLVTIADRLLDAGVNHRRSSFAVSAASI